MRAYPQQAAYELLAPLSMARGSQAPRLGSAEVKLSTTRTFGVWSLTDSLDSKVCPAAAGIQRHAVGTRHRHGALGALGALGRCPFGPFALGQIPNLTRVDVPASCGKVLAEAISYRNACSIRTDSWGNLDAWNSIAFLDQRSLSEASKAWETSHTGGLLPESCKCPRLTRLTRLTRFASCGSRHLGIWHIRSQPCPWDLVGMLRLWPVGLGLVQASLEALREDVRRFLPHASEQLDMLPLSNPPPRQQKIDHLVVLYMENHAADNFFGCMDLPGFEGIKGHAIPKDPADPSKGEIQITCGEAPYVCSKAPSYDTFAPKFGKSGNPHVYPYSAQGDNFSAYNGASANGTAVTMFSPEQIPIKASLARNFGVFNKLFTAAPTASSPNHLFTQSATSCGMTSNVLYPKCGGNGTYFPQPTIYDSMRLHNVSFSFFMNSTCGLDGKPCHGEDPHDPDSGSAISSPDVAMIGVARHKDRFMSQQVFFEQAANGTLPALSWVLPPLQACDHPCHDIAKGERLLKDVYEAVRAGPAWNHTLMFVAYDDAGGYYDHMVPPQGVPADESPCIVPGEHPDCGPRFDFRRLGLRSSAMLISPWVGQGAVFQEPRGPTNTSQFELTSVPATIRSLFNLSFFLTKRDAWAGSFEELLLDSPRAAPMHLPDAPPPATPWTPPPPRTEPHEPRAEPVPQHCSSWHGKEEKQCQGLTHPDLKQLRNIRFFADVLGVPLPDVNSMTSSEAGSWLTKHWRKWMVSLERPDEFYPSAWDTRSEYV